MNDYGLRVKEGSGSTRIEIQCEHQDGLLYIVPGEANWVCPEELRHVHALAGFFKHLESLDNPEVKDAMQRWGLYYRERSLAARP